MSEDRRETIVWDNIPEWALYALEYGIYEDLFITDEDREMVNGFITENFPKGYVMSVDWESYSKFDCYPAFGKPCKIGRKLHEYTVILHRAYYSGHGFSGREF